MSGDETGRPIDPPPRSPADYDRLVEAYEQMSTVFALAERLSMRREEPEVVEVLLELIGRLVPYQDSALLWLDSVGRALEPDPPSKPGSRLDKAVRKAVDEGNVAWAISRERVISDLASDGDGGFFFLPLVGPGGGLGIVAIEVRGEAAELHKYQLGALALLMSHGAIAIENARLYQSVQKQFRESVVLSDDLERSKEDLSRWGEYLERQVESRTAALRDAHGKLQDQHEELIEVHREQDRANERLLELDRLKSEFLQTVSHELKTPLNAIIGYSEVLLDGIGGGLSPEQAGHTRKIVQSARHLLALIVELLDLTRMEAGRVRVNRSRFEVAKAVSAAIAVVAPAAHERAIDINFVHDQLPEEIEADEAKVRQIVINLLQNAVNYTPAGGDVTVGVECTGSTVPDAPVLCGGKVLRFFVSDNGPGIEPVAQARVFERFTRLDPTAGAGTGLGLSITRRLAELHGGRAWVVSPGDRPPAGEKGTGATFYAAIPVS